MGTWNTRQLGARAGNIDQDQKLDALIDIWELRKWEIVTLSDTKLGTNVTLETQSQSQPKWAIISRGRVAIALNEKWTAAWRNYGIVVNTDAKGAQCRSMLIQIPCYQKLGLSVIATYAPSTNTTVEEQQEYLEDLEHLIDQVKPRHILLLGGDFNAEVGIRDANTTALGPFGPPKRNSRGHQLIHFCQDQGLVIANTWTPQNNKTTWWHPRYNTGHLLDYFLVAKKHLGNIHRVLTIHPEVAWEALHRDWTPYTDHSPVEITIKIAPPKGYQKQPTLPPRPATHKGRGKSNGAITLRQQYSEAIQQQLDAGNQTSNWTDLAQLLKDTATQIFGITENKRGKPWFLGRQAEINNLNQQVSRAKAHLLQATQALQQHPHHIPAQHNKPKTAPKRKEN